MGLHRSKVKTTPAVVGVTDVDLNGHPLPAPPTAPDAPPVSPAPPLVLRRRKYLERFGYYEPRMTPMKTTTRQAEALNVAVAAPPTSARGLIVGVDAMTGQVVHHDPFAAYEAKLISSGNVVVIGDVGKGKALDVQTRVWTPTGLRRLGDLQVGDQVYGSDGKWTTVIAVLEPYQVTSAYRVLFDDGAQLVADADHLWVTDETSRIHAAAVAIAGLRGARTGERSALLSGVLTTSQLAEAASASIVSVPAVPGLGLLARRVVSVTPVGAVTVSCIQVDAEDGVYLAGPEKIPTHNSSLIKTWAALRQLTMGRRVVIIDKKLQNGLGEYTPLARFFGVTPIRFTTDGRGSRINLLDPVISSRSSQEGSAADQSMLLRAVLAEALGRPITPREGKALREAHRAAHDVARPQDRVAVIGDIVTALLNPSQASADRAAASIDQMREFGRDAAYELERLIEDDLAGLIDAPTSDNVTLNNLLTVFDVSALPEDGPALPIVMTIINTWLTNQLMAAKGQQTVFIIEEAWHIVSGSVAEVTRRNLKLQRGVGLMNVMAIHHISDVPADSPAIAIIKEAGTVFIYGQDRTDDAAACGKLFNLPDTAVEALMDMPQGSCLLKIGSRNALMVNHIRSDIEVELTNTDDAMLGIARQAESAETAELDLPDFIDDRMATP